MPELSEQEFDASRFSQKENLIKVGDDINLTARDPSMKKVVIGVGWDLNAFNGDAVDVDVSCFLIDKNGQTRNDTDFVFYNNPEGCAGAVVHTGDSRHGAGEGDDENITIDVPGVPFDVVQILFAVSIYGAYEAEQNLGMVRNAYIRFLNADRNEELMRYEFGTTLPKHQETAVVIASLDREGPKWHVRPMAEFYPGGLAEIARKFGIVIAERG